ncbi:MAG: CsbD family protein [Isosphaeraceae bacterium]|nr:CsbD family protein [Isosphaeraceae bacterium]
MNWDQVAGEWKQFRGHVKEKWGKLTDDELTTIAGKRDQLAGLLQEKYGYAKDHAEMEIDRFAKALKH